jgi:hypothetical protein
MEEKAEETDIVREQKNITTLFTSLDGITKAFQEKVSETYSYIEEERSKFKEEKEQYEKVTKKLERYQVPNLIKLNVGGQIFSTTLATLKNAGPSKK